MPLIKHFAHTEKNVNRTAHLPSPVELGLKYYLHFVSNLTIEEQKVERVELQGVKGGVKGGFKSDSGL